MGPTKTSSGPCGSLAMWPLFWPPDRSSSGVPPACPFSPLKILAGAYHKPPSLVESCIVAAGKTPHTDPSKGFHGSF